MIGQLNLPRPTPHPKQKMARARNPNPKPALRNKKKNKTAKQSGNAKLIDSSPLKRPSPRAIGKGDNKRNVARKVIIDIHASESDPEDYDQKMAEKSKYSMFNEIISLESEPRFTIRHGADVSLPSSSPTKTLPKKASPRESLTKKGSPAHRKPEHSDFTDSESEENMRAKKNVKDLQDKISNLRPNTRKGKNRKSKGISEEFKEVVDKQLNEEESVIMRSANFLGKRRPRIAWTEAEVSNLLSGVEEFGQSWANIIKHYSFNESRTMVDLKDKFRNLKHYKSYGQHPLRYFTIVDQHHRPILTPSGAEHRYKNRWPRDAANKAASKDDFYPPNQNTVKIFIREIDGDAEMQEATKIPPIVHVYIARRWRALPPKHLADHNVSSVWHTDVRKIREERLFTREDLEKMQKNK